MGKHETRPMGIDSMGGVCFDAFRGVRVVKTRFSPGRGGLPALLVTG